MRGYKQMITALFRLVAAGAARQKRAPIHCLHIHIDARTTQALDQHHRGRIVLGTVCRLQDNNLLTVIAGLFQQLFGFVDIGLAEGLAAQLDAIVRSAMENSIYRQYRRNFG